MASDITLLIVDPTKRAVVVSRWVGMGATRDRLREVLARAPDFAEQGRECWGRVRGDEALAVVETAYANGATRQDVEQWSAAFPAQVFWWIFEHDY